MFLMNLATCIFVRRPRRKAYLDKTFTTSGRTSSWILHVPGHFQSLPLWDLGWISRIIIHVASDMHLTSMHWCQVQRRSIPSFFHATGVFRIYFKMHCMNTIISLLLVFKLPPLLFNLNRNAVTVLKSSIIIRSMLIHHSFHGMLIIR